MHYLLLAAIAVLMPGSVMADEVRWQRTANNGCLVWDALPQRDETVTWSGACIDGKASGPGTEVFRYRVAGVWKEERYVGDMQGGKLHGRGTLYYDNGDRYEGPYVEAKRVGQGTYTHANGDRYEGEFRDDKVTGRGTFTYHTGARYEGEFVDGKFQGRGVFTFANGDRYEGDFRGGLPNGTGTFTARNGEVVTGTWSNGCGRQGERVAAVGTTKDRCGFQ